MADDGKKGGMHWPCSEVVRVGRDVGAAGPEESERAQDGEAARRAGKAVQPVDEVLYQV